MQITETNFPGLLIMEPTVHRDERGFFLETFREDNFAKRGIDFVCKQANQSYSSQKGVLRGLHFQTPPKAQAKLVWVTKGEVLDVVVDLRSTSPTFGQAYSIYLSADNFKRFFVPKGFAHGYFTLTAETEFNYMVDEYYSPEHEGGIIWSDPSLAIDWQLDTLHGGKKEEPIVSLKDSKLPLFNQLAKIFK